jgi:integrase
MRKRWQTTGVKAGVPGRIPHDFRRTAVQPERRGVARSVAMKITGRKTESVCRRYAIVSDADLREATEKLDHEHISGHSQAGVVDSASVNRQNS